jgi:hypothetical protein
MRLLQAIELIDPPATPFRRVRPPIVPPGAIVYLLSTLLDDNVAQLALRWRGAGHRVIAVDVLPTPKFARTTRYERVAHRLVMMERQDRVRTMSDRGVETLTWSEGDGSITREAQMRLLSRPRIAGRSGSGR